MQPWMHFFLVLNSGNGAVINFTAYNDGITGDEWFNSIEPASAGSFGGPGYIVGGRVVSQYNTPMIGYTPWMIKTGSCRKCNLEHAYPTLFRDH